MLGSRGSNQVGLIEWKSMHIIQRIASISAIMALINAMMFKGLLISPGVTEDRLEEIHRMNHPM